MLGIKRQKELHDVFSSVIQDNILLKPFLWILVKINSLVIRSHWTSYCDKLLKLEPQWKNPPSNNLSKLAVNPVAISRKNSLFSDSTDRAKLSAIIFSIINTTSSNNWDTYKYIEYIFETLPKRDSIKKSASHIYCEVEFFVQ